MKHRSVPSLKGARHHTSWGPGSCDGLPISQMKWSSRTFHMCSRSQLAAADLAWEHSCVCGPPALAASGRREREQLKNSWTPELGFTLTLALTGLLVSPLCLYNGAHRADLLGLGSDRPKRVMRIRHKDRGWQVTSTSAGSQRWSVHGAWHSGLHPAERGPQATWAQGSPRALGDLGKVLMMAVPLYETAGFPHELCSVPGGLARLTWPPAQLRWGLHAVFSHFVTKSGSMCSPPNSPEKGGLGERTWSLPGTGDPQTLELLLPKRGHVWA